MLFETHAHLSDSQFDFDRNDIVARALNQNISTIVEIADGPAEWIKAKQLSDHYPAKVYWTAGLHPYFADQGDDSTFTQLKKWAQLQNCVAVGEIGLDYFRKCTVPRDRQKSTFIKALQLAQELVKPVVIHCREAYSDLIPILKKALLNKPGSPGVIHCFSGTPQDADALTQLGFYLGVDGPLTYPNADPLRAVFKHVPLKYIVLETDSPYLPPQGYRGKRNEPSHLIYIAQKLAEIKNRSLEDVAAITYQNGVELYRLNQV